MATDSSGRRTPWRTIIAAILAVLALIFVVQNLTSTHMKFLWGTFKSPLWLMLIITLAAGIVIGLLVGHRLGERAKPKKK